MRYEPNPRRPVLRLRSLLALLALSAVAAGCSAVGLRMTPDPVRAALGQGAAQMQAGQYSAAETTYRSALAANPDAEIALALVDLYIQWQAPDKGLDALALARSLGTPEDIGTPDDVFEPRQLELLTIAGDWHAVRETAEIILTAEPDDEQALGALLQAALTQGDCEQAESAAQRLATLDAATSGDAAETHLLLSGDFTALQAASPLLMAGLEACGDTCGVQMGLRLVRAQRWGEAACLLERALGTGDGGGVNADSASGLSDTQLGEAFAWLGEAKSRTGHPLDAERYLRTAVDLAPESPLAWLLLGNQRLGRGDLDTARVALLNAQRLDPANPAPCLAIAQVKAQSGAYTQVDRWVDAALERAPEDAEIWKAAARFYLSRNLVLGRDPGLIADRAVTLAPQDAEAFLLRGWSALLQADPQTGLADLDRAVALTPASAEAHHLRGLVLEALGQAEEAEAAYTRAADLGWRTE